METDFASKSVLKSSLAKCSELKWKWVCFICDLSAFPVAGLAIFCTLPQVIKYLLVLTIRVLYLFTVAQLRKSLLNQLPCFDLVLKELEMTWDGFMCYSCLHNVWAVPETRADRFSQLSSLLFLGVTWSFFLGLQLFVCLNTMSSI